MTTTDDKPASIADQIRAAGAIPAQCNVYDDWFNQGISLAAGIAAEGEAALRAELRQAYTQIQTDARQLREAIDAQLQADRDRLAADLKVAREALAQIAGKPSAMTWGEDCEVLDAMRAMEAIADAAIARIMEADNE